MHICESLRISMICTLICPKPNQSSPAAHNSLSLGAELSYYSPGWNWNPVFGSKGQSHWLCPVITTIIPSTQYKWEYMEWNKLLLCFPFTWPLASLHLLSFIPCHSLSPLPRYSTVVLISSSLPVFIIVSPLCCFNSILLFLSIFLSFLTVNNGGKRRNCYSNSNPDFLTKDLGQRRPTQAPSDC